jgi:hypothetical protein
MFEGLHTLSLWSKSLLALQQKPTPRDGAVVLC